MKNEEETGKKYEPLWNYFKVHYQLSYEQIKELLGFGVAYSFLTDKK